MNAQIRNSQSVIRNSQWCLVTVEVSRDTGEEASALLFELGSTGIITLDENSDAITLGAYFYAGTHADDIKTAIEAEFARIGRRDALTNFSVSSVPDEDWMQKWKEGFEPVEIGTRLVIAPSWRLPGANNNRLVVQVDPGMAFGTGTHETTRLCLEAIENVWRGGGLLDVGTGTGILAIAAALLVPGSRVVAIDIDPQAVEVASENLAINSVSKAVDLSEGQPHNHIGRGFDVVVANLTAEVIIALMDDLAGCLAPAGLMILSGILKELAQDVERSLAAAGLTVNERHEAGEWSALIAGRA